MAQEDKEKWFNLGFDEGYSSPMGIGNELIPIERYNDRRKENFNEVIKQIKMENKYYYLKKGEVIQEGDEVEVSNKWNDPAKWIKSKNCIGDKAPDPQFMAHRKYRRLN